MDPVAIVMMIVALVLVWGGLIAAILFLRSRPQVVGGPYEDPDLVLDDTERGDQPHPFRDT
jgi:hypothetical protein